MSAMKIKLVPIEEDEILEEEERRKLTLGEFAAMAAAIAGALALFLLIWKKVVKLFTGNCSYPNRKRGTLCQLS